MTTKIASDTTVQFRMDSGIKEGAFSVFREMGITPSEAVRVFFKHVQKTRTLPFIITANEGGMEPEEGYNEWLHARLTKAIHRLDSGEMKSYPIDEARKILQEQRAEWRKTQSK